MYSPKAKSMILRRNRTIFELLTCSFILRPDRGSPCKLKNGAKSKYCRRQTINVSCLCQSRIQIYRMKKCLAQTKIKGLKLLQQYTEAADRDLIRLIGGTNVNEGRVEIYHNSEWIAVCDDQWDTNDATVVCRQLGLPYGNVRTAGGSSFGRGSGVVLFDDVGCTGDESRLIDCYHHMEGNDFCYNGGNAGVVCTDCKYWYEQR